MPSVMSRRSINSIDGNGPSVNSGNTRQIPSAAKSAGVNTVAAGVPLVKFDVSVAVAVSEVVEVFDVADVADVVESSVVAAAVSAVVSTGDGVVVGSPPLESPVMPGVDVLADSDPPLHPTKTIPAPRAEAPTPNSWRRVMISIMSGTVPT